MGDETPLFAEAPLVDILEFVQSRLASGASTVRFRVLDPDLGRGLHAGERVRRHGRPFVHRSWRVWADLAERLQLRLGTPKAAGEGLVWVELVALEPRARWEPDADTPTTEKYGRASPYQRITKLEEPGFVLDLADALERVGPPSFARVLDLGVNTGDEFILLSRLSDELGKTATFVGVDHSASAIEVATKRFESNRYRFVRADLAELPRLDLGERFDLVVSVATLQSPGVDDRALLRHVVQERLKSTGSIILGVPNCRYLDGEVLHGARMKNFRQPELSLVIKNVAFYRRYLQQHRRKVYVTGKNVLLVTATPVDGRTPPRVLGGRAQSENPR